MAKPGIANFSQSEGLSEEINSNFAKIFIYAKLN